MSAPGKIILIRHGQSAANADTSIYNRVPDYRIPLTPLGIEQATAAGEQVRRQLDGRQVCVYVSPYLRAYQTLEALNLGPLVERVIEEPRLRE
ncbi:MAG TPA: phosphoglycerate mutase family protein, partial [Arthrobacter sp.]|nr:phosphoglycerate mutase family protein [Arthrobacter sp.]